MTITVRNPSRVELSQPTRRLIVGIMGRKRSGKDTVAARLVEAHGFRRLAFADRLREAVLDLDPIVVPVVGSEWASLRLSEVLRRYDGWERAKEIPEVRRILQNYGQSVRRINPDFWLRPVLEQIDTYPTRATVISDVRYPNEARAITSRGGVLIRVYRPGQDTSDTHESETALNGWYAHSTICNGSTIADLHTRVDDLIISIRDFGHR